MRGSLLSAKYSDFRLTEMSIHISRQKFKSTMGVCSSEVTAINLMKA